MTYAFPGDVQQMVEAHLASGRYANEDDVLRNALWALTHEEEDLVAVRQAIDKWRVGDEGATVAEAFNQVRRGHAEILTRVIAPERATLPADAAQALLELEFTPDDRCRMHELVVKNQDGTLTPEEKDELDGYVDVGLLLDLLRSKARRSLKAAQG